MKNNLFNFFQERSRPAPDYISADGRYFYGHGRVLNIDIALDLIEPNDVVLCDSNIFTGRHLSLLESLLRLPNEILITDDVQREVKLYLDAPPRTEHDRAVIRLLTDPSKKSIRPLGPLPWDEHVVAVYNYYVNLLFQRRTALGYARAAYEARYGVPPTGKDKSRIAKELAILSKSTVALSNKKGAGTSVTDERLVAHSLFLAALDDMAVRRNIVVMTEDSDVFAQTYKLLNLAVDDYLSYLFAEALHARPELPVRIPLVTEPWRKPGRVVRDESKSFVVPRQPDILRLLPPQPAPTELLVIRPGDQPQLFFAVLPGEIGHFLHFKGKALGKNTLRYGELNCYIQLPFLTPPALPATSDRPAYFISDVVAIDASAHGFRISTIDILRCIGDIEKPVMFNTIGHLGQEMEVARAPCPCESGLAFANCHGREASTAP